MIAKSLRLFGVEDGSFSSFPVKETEYTLLCGVETLDNKILKIGLTKIKVDGLDVTEKLLKLLQDVTVNSIILGGITFGGFNIVDANKIYKETKTPIIVYTGEEPNNKGVQQALKKHFPDWKTRWDLIENLGSVYSTKPHSKEPMVYFETIGCTRLWASIILKKAAVLSRIPEPVRVAGIIARSLSPI